MKLAAVLIGALASLVLTKETASPLTLTYSTFKNGKVSLATTTYESVLGPSPAPTPTCARQGGIHGEEEAEVVSQTNTKTKSRGHHHHHHGCVTRYSLNRADLAYPTFAPIPSAVAGAAAGPGLPNATVFAQQGLQLIFKFSNANSTNCQQCKDLMGQVQKSAAIEQEFLGRIAEPFCKSLAAFVPMPICVGLFRIGSTDVGAIFGSTGTDMQGQDGQLLCAFLFGLCELPAPPKLDLQALFNGTTKPPPKKLTPSKKKPLKVLHISDYHLDPRYVVGSEANCTGGVAPTVCCRVFPYTNTSTPISEKASLFGSYKCDTPEALGTSVFRNVPKVTGHKWDEFAFGIFTGDLVSHDVWALTKPYVLANMELAYQHFFDGMEGVPLYPTLGNHDTFPQAFTSFRTDNSLLPNNASYQSQQRYIDRTVRKAWENYGWLSHKEAQRVVSSGLGIYRAKTKQGLTIISMNSDVWYQFNLYAYIKGNQIDPTGSFKQLISWLHEAEENNDPVWLIQHVNVGGSNNYEALPAASDLFYQVVDRFNNTIRATFFGHTHNDEFGVFYTKNGTVQNANTATSVAYIGPSVTTYQELNAGFRYYLVDAETFNVIDSINYYANVSNTDQWTKAGDATWEFEYSARDTYDPDGKLLGPNPRSPLTAAFWHQVTENIKTNATTFKTYTDLRNKLYRPYEAPNFVENPRIKCGLNSMSVPLFEKCLGSMKVLDAFL